jgi:hypothetical protein
VKPAIAIVALLVTVVTVATGCASSARSAEPLTLPPRPPPGPWTVTRNALVGCATDHGLSGDLVTRIEIGEDGLVLNVFSGYGDSYARCVGTSMMQTRFTAQRGRTFDLNFHVIPPGEPQTAESPAVCPEGC